MIAPFNPKLHRGHNLIAITCQQHINPPKQLHDPRYRFPERRLAGMDTPFSGSPALLEHLRSALPHAERAQLRASVLPSLLGAISKIALTLQNSQHVALAGSSNTFGDDQLNVDVSAENHLRQALAECPSVATASSEEDPVETPVAHASDTDTGVERYTVAFDPLDGSSIIAPNWTVGAILGIWDGESALGQSPRDKQVAAILGVFGPRTTAIVALRIPGSNTSSCFEIGLGGEQGQTWDIVRSNVQLAAGPPYKTRYFAPANLRAAAESERYMEFVAQCIAEKYTLRYSGGLVPDVVHALVKGHGVYVSPVTSASDAKLRKLYELFPVALIVECAGGAAVNPEDGEDILNGALGNTDERGGLVCGNRDEVAKAAKVLLGR